MVHGELGALNITGFILPYATTNWLVREYSNVSEGGRRGMITFDGLFSLIKIMLKTDSSGGRGGLLYGHLCIYTVYSSREMMLTGPKCPVSGASIP